MNAEANTVTTGWYLDGVDFDNLNYRVAFATLYLTPKDLLINPEWLLSTAEKAEARYRDMRESHPPGTFHAERNLMHDLASVAIEVAEWMEKRGDAEARYAGPFGPRLPERGARVKIRQGAVVHSTHPRVGKEGVRLERNLTVTVRSCDRGYVDTTGREERGEQRVKTSQVNWAGAGGYWRWTEAANIISVD